jgi:hypothetical protein
MGVPPVILAELLRPNALPERRQSGDASLTPRGKAGTPYLPPRGSAPQPRRYADTFPYWLLATGYLATGLLASLPRPLPFRSKVLITDIHS